MFDVDYSRTPSAPSTPSGLFLAELTLFLGPALAFAASFLIPSFETTQETLEWVRDNSLRADISKFLDLLAMPFLLGGVIVLFLLTRDASQRLASLAAIALALGYVGQTATHGSQMLAFELADDGVDIESLAEALETDTVAGWAALLMMFGGWLFGVLAIVLGLVRSPATPSAAAAAFLLAPVALVVFPETPELAWGLVTAGVAVIALTIERQRRATSAG